MYIYIRVYTGSGNTCEACAYSMFDGIHIYIHVYTGSGNTYNVYIHMQMQGAAIHARRARQAKPKHMLVCTCVLYTCVCMYVCVFMYV